jgi:hypothetical protein
MFRVRWKKSALAELTSLWMGADSERRQAITEAAHQIDQQLQLNPDKQGESRPDGRRIFFAPPLGVLFRIFSEQSVVRVLQVWQY